jgi:hypothetical protein
MVLPQAADGDDRCRGWEERLRLFVGDEWSEADHDVELMDATGRRLARLGLLRRGTARVHTLVGDQLGEDADDTEVLVGIETDRGPWVQALLAAGYTVFAVNPLQAARYRDRLGVSGAKSDASDAHILADVVRTDSHQLRSVAGDSPQAEAIKGGGAGAQDADLGAHPPLPAAAARAAGVLSRRAGGV